MLTFENRIQIEQPVGEVYEFLADMENIPKWNYYVVDVSKIDDGPVQPGATYHQVRRSDEQKLRIVELSPPKTIVVQTTPDSTPQLKRTFKLAPNGAATEITDQWELESGLPGLVEKLAARRTKGAVRENLRKLKQLLEHGWVILQDGRREAI